MISTMKQREIGNAYVTIRALKDGGYDTSITEYGRVIRRNYYGDIDKATRCFYRYVSQVKRGFQA